MPAPNMSSAGLSAALGLRCVGDQDEGSGVQASVIWVPDSPQRPDRWPVGRHPPAPSRRYGAANGGLWPVLSAGAPPPPGPAHRLLAPAEAWAANNVP